MIKPILFFMTGLVFGVGLTVSQMVNPNKIQHFLDIFGDWDPSLLFVMLGAVLVTSIGYKLVLRRKTPLLSREFILPSRSDIDRPLVIGAALFGIGWGMSGFCPAPAITSIAIGVWDSLIMCVGMAVGSLLYWFFHKQ